MLNLGKKEDVGKNILRTQQYNQIPVDENGFYWLDKVEYNEEWDLKLQRKSTKGIRLNASSEEVDVCSKLSLGFFTCPLSCHGFPLIVDLFQDLFNLSLDLRASISPNLTPSSWFWAFVPLWLYTAQTRLDRNWIQQGCLHVTASRIRRSIKIESCMQA